MKCPECGKQLIYINGEKQGKISTEYYRCDPCKKEFEKKEDKNLFLKKKIVDKTTFN